MKGQIGIANRAFVLSINGAIGTTQAEIKKSLLNGAKALQSDLQRVIRRVTSFKLVTDDHVVLTLDKISRLGVGDSWLKNRSEHGLEESYFSLAAPHIL